MSGRTDTIRVLFVASRPGAGATTADRLDRAAADVDVVAATSAAAAREALADASFDCVVSRADLPDEDGVELLRSVRERYPDLPFVLFPEAGSEALASEAISAGVTEYLRCDPDIDQSPALATRVRTAVDATADRQRPAEHTGQDLNQSAGPDDPPPSEQPRTSDHSPSSDRTPAPDRDAEADSDLEFALALGMDESSQANLLEQLFTQIPVSLYVKDREGRHLLMSDYDTTPVEAVGKTDLEIYDERLARESYEDDMHVIETGEPIRNKEEYNPAVDGWTLTSKVPWYGRDGEIQGLIGVTRFITEKKEYEREIERKNERLERFASVVSHDLRNPLTVAQGRLEFVEDASGGDHVEKIGDALDRMEVLISDVLELARQGQSIDETEAVTLSTALDRAWAHVETGDATCESAGDVRFQADRSRLVELLANLVRNSVEHGSTSARWEAGNPADDGSSESVTVRAGPLDGGFYVEDDGSGIPDDDKDDVFDAGYTTDADGTGFGLAIVSEIVDAHGWTIDVADAESGGARFEITGVEAAEPPS